MAVVETLEVRFQTNLKDFSAQLKAVAMQIEGVGTALEAGRSTAMSGAAELIRGVGSALLGGAGMSAAPGQAGGMLASGFADSIRQGADGAAFAARQVVAAAKFSDAAAAASAYSSGAALSQGFANGIGSGYGTVMRAVNRIVNAAVSRIRSALSIHSPSKVSFELGGYFAEGFAKGVLGGISMAQRSAQALSVGSSEAVLAAPTGSTAEFPGNGVGGMVRSAVEEVLGGTSIVIPLHVDGVKLGEASIRGINQVTRNAGRMMLEI